MFGLGKIDRLKARVAQLERERDAAVAQRDAAMATARELIELAEQTVGEIQAEKE